MTSFDKKIKFLFTKFLDYKCKKKFISKFYISFM